MVYPIYSISKRQSGIALLLAIFVLAFATIIVMGLSYQSRFDARASRAFAESVQADYILKSGFTVAQALIEFPKGFDKDKKAITADWLGDDLWAKVSSFDNLNSVLSGVVGEVRLEIVDEDGKIDLNAFSGRASVVPSPTPTPHSGHPTTPTIPDSEFWMESAAKIFDTVGFRPETSEEDKLRTPGGSLFDSNTQAAVIRDWIDNDTVSFSPEAFSGLGMESSLDRTLFFNRPLKNLTEVLLVPGMTLERLIQISPYITVGKESSASAKKININTAPVAVLEAMGVPEAEASIAAEERMIKPLDPQMVKNLAGGDPKLQTRFKYSSNQFVVYVRVKTSNAIRWAKADVDATGVPPARKTALRGVEFH